MTSALGKSYAMLSKWGSTANPIIHPEVASLNTMSESIHQVQ